jgi:D-alanyl-D-alanine carboxypeptidase
MTTRKIVLAVTAVLLATSGCADKSTPPQSSATSSAASSETAKQMNDALAQRLDAAVNHAMTAAGVPGAIIGIWGPDGDYVRAFGVADKNTRAPMKADFYSRIGSVTKTFTVTAVLQLADQGKLSLDDPIAEFVDGVPLGAKITLR